MVGAGIFLIHLRILRNKSKVILFEHKKRHAMEFFLLLKETKSFVLIVLESDPPNDWLLL